MEFAVPFETKNRVVGFARGEYTRYPGLPEDESRTQTATFITEEIPDARFFHNVDEMYGQDHVIFQYTIDELRGMRWGLPSTFHRIASLFPDLFSPNELIVDDRARGLQLQTEFQTRVSTADAGFIHGRRKMDTATSKARTALRIDGLCAGLGIPLGFTADLFGPYTEDRLDDILITFKKEMFKTYDRIDWPLVAAETTTLEERLTPREHIKFGYRDWLHQKLGDNLVAIGVYGSSTQTDDPEKYDDYDNWVVVHDVDAACQKLRGTKPKYNPKTGKVGEDGKHLGILIFPVDGKMLHDYTRFLDDNEEFRTKMKVIYNSITLAKTDRIENTERGISQSYVKAKTTADAVANFLRKPEELRNKNLFEFFVKILRFNYKNAIRYHEGKVLGKEDLDRRLRADHGIIVPKFRDDPRYLIDALVYARQCTAYIQRELFKGVELRWEYFTHERPLLRAA